MKSSRTPIFPQKHYLWNWQDFTFIFASSFLTTLHGSALFCLDLISICVSFILHATISLASIWTKKKHETFKNSKYFRKKCKEILSKKLTLSSNRKCFPFHAIMYSIVKKPQSMLVNKKNVIRWHFGTWNKVLLVKSVTSEASILVGLFRTFYSDLFERNNIKFHAFMYLQ